MGRLRKYLAAEKTARTVVLGDYNVAPTDKDVHFPEKWAGKIHCSEPERAAYFAYLEDGFVDTLRALRPDEEVLTWWDYRMLAFPKNNGLRIDHILATPALAKKVTAVDVFRDERKGQQPSDHIPVVATIS
jgi:exodeoxyribonuclease III